MYTLAFAKATPAVRGLRHPPERSTHSQHQIGVLTTPAATCKSTHFHFDNSHCQLKIGFLVDPLLAEPRVCGSSRVEGTLASTFQTTRSVFGSRNDVHDGGDSYVQHLDPIPHQPRCGSASDSATLARPFTHCRSCQRMLGIGSSAYRLRSNVRGHFVSTSPTAQPDVATPRV
jgi:hypothetical protein